MTTGIEEIQTIILELIEKELAISRHEIDPTRSFQELGLDSVNSLFLLDELERKLQLDIDPLSLYDNPTINSFASYLYQSLNGSR